MVLNVNKSQTDHTGSSWPNAEENFIKFKRSE